MPLTKHPALLASDVRYWMNHGLSLDELTRAAGVPVSPHVLSGERSDAAVIYRLYCYTSRRLNDPLMGLRIGHQTLISDIAPLVSLIHYAPDGWHMLRAVQHFWPLLSEVDQLEIHVEGGLCHARLRPLADDLMHPQQSEAMISGFLRLAGVVLGIDQTPEVCVHLRRRCPAQPAAWKALSGVPVRFGCDMDEVCFGRTLLDTPNPSADVAAFRQARQLAGRELALLRQQFFSDDIAQLILERLPDGVPEIADVAAGLHVSVRCLQRRLQQQQTRFRSLVDQVRCHQARALVANTSLGFADIAQQLGYTETGTLFRAFRRWTGMTPGQYRAREGLSA